MLTDLKHLSKILYVIISIYVVICAPSVEANTTGHNGMPSYQSFESLSIDSLSARASNFLRIDLNPDSALIYLNIVVKKLDKEGLDKENADGACRALINLSIIYKEYFYDYAKAYDYMLKAKAIADRYNYKKAIPYIHMCAASILQYIDTTKLPDLPQPMQELKQAFKTAVINKDETMVIMATINMCDLVNSGIDYNTATDDLSVAEKYVFHNNPDEVDFMRMYIMATKAKHSGDYDIALKLFDILSTHPITPLFNRKLRLSLLMHKNNILSLQGKETESGSLLDSILTYARRSNSQEFELSALRKLSLHYANLGDTSRAHHYNYRYYVLNDSLLAHNNIMRVKDIAFMDNLNNALEKVKILNIEKRNRNIGIMAACIVAILAIILNIYYVRTQQKLKEANEVLKLRVDEILHTPMTATNIMQHKPYVDNDNEASSAESTDPESSTIDEVKGNRLSEERARMIFDKVCVVLEESPEVFDTDFSIRQLSTIISEPYYDISSAINDMTGANFKTLLLQRRIKEACRILSKPEECKRNTVEGIALNLGFKSRTYFYSVFKKCTGMTPKVFMSIAHSKAADNGHPDVLS